MTTANLTIQDNDTVIQYTATAAQTVFPYDFPILDSGELKVSVDQVDKTLTTDYTVSGVGDAGGGNVTFGTPMAGGEIVTLWLDMPLKRLTGFNEGAATLLGTDLNTELVRQVRHDQMLRRDIRRALRLAPDDPNAGQDMELPTSTVRQGKFLAFDANGKPTVADVTGSEDTSLRADLADGATAGKGHNLVAITRTDAEIAAGVTPTNYEYGFGNILRYGASSSASAATNLAALNAAVSVAITGSSNRIIIPEVGDYFEIAAEWNIPASTFLHIEWNGRLKFTGTSGIAVSFGTFGSPGSRTDFLTISGRGVWVEAETTTWANGVIGVDIYGCFNTRANIMRITGFSSGLRFRGDSTYATEYSGFYLGGAQIVDNKIDIEFSGEADNENSFYGGRICQSNSAHSGELSGSCGLKVAQSNNNNRFYGLSMEAGSTGIKERKFDIDGQNIVLDRCRYEGSQSNSCGILRENSQNCELCGGLQLLTVRDDDGVVDLGTRNMGYINYYRWHAGEFTWHPTTGTLQKPTAGNWHRNDIIKATQAADGRETYYVCTTTGTLGTLNGGSTTGGITSGQTTLTVNDNTDLARNQYITIAGVSGIKKVVDIDGADVTIDVAADATVAGAAVAYATPVFRAAGHAWDQLPSIYSGGEGYLSWNPGSLDDGEGETSPDFTVTGVDFNFAIIVKPPYDMQGIAYSGYVSAADTVKVRIQNETGGTINLGSGTWYVRALRMFD